MTRGGNYRIDCDTALARSIPPPLLELRLAVLEERRHPLALVVGTEQSGERVPLGAEPVTTVRPAGRSDAGALLHVVDVAGFVGGFGLDRCRLGLTVDLW